MIAPATTDDLPRLLDMGESFFGASGLAEFGAFERDACEKTMFACIHDDDKALLIAKDGGATVGMLAMTLVPFYAAPKIIFAQELFWWVAPNARKRGLGRELLDAAETWAKSKGATVLSMVALGKAEELRAVAQLYERAGFDLLETTWARRI